MIRPARPQDDAAIVALWQACDLLRPWNDPLADIAFCRSSANAELLVAADLAEQTVQASVMVGHDGHRGWVYYVAVGPNQQRSGLGRRIMAAAEAWLAEREVPKVQLIIRSENQAVVDFYRTLGYEVEERVVMSRRLKPAADAMEIG